MEREKVENYDELNDLTPEGWRFCRQIINWVYELRKMPDYEEKFRAWHLEKYGTLPEEELPCTN